MTAGCITKATALVAGLARLGFLQLHLRPVLKGFIWPRADDHHGPAARTLRRQQAAALLRSLTSHQLGDTSVDAALGVLSLASCSAASVGRRAASLAAVGSAWCGQALPSTTRRRHRRHITAAAVGRRAT